MPDSDNGCALAMHSTCERGRIPLMEKLRSSGVESAQVHYRNDRYSIFNGRKNDLPEMDSLEEKYIVIPLHHKVSEKSALKICNIINNFLYHKKLASNNSLKGKKILFFGIKNCKNSINAIKHLESKGCFVKSVLGSRRGEKMPLKLFTGKEIIFFHIDIG